MPEQDLITLEKDGQLIHCEEGSLGHEQALAKGYEQVDSPDPVAESPNNAAPSDEQNETDNGAGSEVLSLEEAVMHCMEPGNEDCLTNTGKPNLDKLKELTGEIVTAAQRDEVFKALQE